MGRWAPIDQLQLTLGVDGMFDRAKLLGSEENWETGNQYPWGEEGTQSVGYQTYAAFLELFTENKIVNGAVGVRWDYSSYLGGAGAFVPRAVVFRSFGPVNLKALFSMAFRSPGVENINVGEDIKSENTTVFEFEGSWDIMKNMRFSANIFNVGINAPITYYADGAGEGYRNVGKVGTCGVELGYALRGDWGRVAANYSYYMATSKKDAEAYLVDSPGDEYRIGYPRRTNQFFAAPAHKISLTGTYKPLPWLAISPSIVVIGERFGLEPEAQDEDAEEVIETVRKEPWHVLANLFVRIVDQPVKGLEFGIGIYNIFGANFRYLVPASGGSAAIPGLDRQILLRIGYTFEPSYD